MNNCEQKGKKNGVLYKAVGIALIAAGGFIVLCCVPLWFWGLILGAALAAGGFMIWKYGG